MVLEELVEQVARRVGDGGPSHRKATMADLVLLGQDSPSEFEATLYKPTVCVVLLGRKQVSVGDQTLSFGRGECLLVSHDLPLHSRIVEVPYLALALALDIGIIRKLHDEVTLPPLESESALAARTHVADRALLDALRRYVALSDSPEEARVLGPLVCREIHYRLLVAPFGGMLRKLIRHDSSASAISRAIDRLREHIRSPIPIPDLARHVGMSSSSFHKHFTTITATTPLQYLKELRLLEARRLLRTGASVSSAAFDVGYESLSQFSREYTRKFGSPPSQDRAEPGILNLPTLRSSSLHR